MKPAVTLAAKRLGLEHGRGRWGACPTCSASSTRDGRPPIRIDRPDQRWWCNACDAHGDAVDLVTAARPELGYREALELLDHGPILATVPREVLEPDRVPAEQLAAVLRRATAPATDARASAWLRDRGLDAALTPAGILPRGFGASWWPRAWSATWRLVVPAFSGTGDLCSMQARAIDADASPKTRWPLGADAGGSLFADPRLGRGLLRGETSGVTSVLFVEGLTDYLAATAAAQVEGLTGLAVLGISSGSVSAIHLLRLPAGVRIYVATDPDPAGNRYAQQIADALAPHICRRVPLELLMRRAA